MTKTTVSPGRHLKSVLENGISPQHRSLKEILALIMKKAEPDEKPVEKPSLKNRLVVGTVDRLVVTNPTTRNRVTFHVSPQESHQALLESIRTAKKSFYIETFIWHDDAAGNEVIDALARRVKDARAKGETFDAKVLIDWLGLRGSAGGVADTAILEKFKQAGIEVIEHSPGYVNWEQKLISPITHRKLYIKDGASFITGGRNIGNEYLKPEYDVAGAGKEASWHDLMYTVEGEETGRILDEFFKNWQRAGGKLPAEMPVVEPVAGGKTKIQSVTTDPYTAHKGIREAHSRAIKLARHEIVAVYPYFSDDTLVRQLIEAKQANPKLSVKVMMPAAKEASHEGTLYAMLNKETARQLMEAGIEVRMFEGGDVQRFSHMKAMVFDGKLLSIGSANGDHRTFNNNHELNTLIADHGVVETFMAKVIRPDWKAARPADANALEAESTWERIKQRVLEWFDFLF